jgi:DNA mismatch repair protein MutS2
MQSRFVGGRGLPEVEHLEQIPGVGAKLAAKLVEATGSEAAALDIILSAQAEMLASIPGVGKRTALTIVQEAYTLREGISPFEVLKTEDIRELYQQILQIIQTYANSLFAKDKLCLYYPLPSSKMDVIKLRQDWFRQAAEFVAKCQPDSLENLGQLLSQARPLRRAASPKMATWRVIVTDSDEYLSKLKQLGADKTSRLIRLQPGERLNEYLESYDFVLAALQMGRAGSAVEHAGNIELVKSDFGLVDVSPETVISFYATNHDTILAICEAAEALQRMPSTPALERFLQKLDMPALRELVATVKRIESSGDVAEGVDQDFDRLRQASRKFETIVSEAEIWANDRIRGQVSSSQVVLEGDQVLNILEAAAAEAIDSDQLRRYLPPQVFDILMKSTQEAEDKLGSLLQLRRNELEWVDGIFSETVALPLQADRQKVSKLQNYLRRATHEREHQLKSQIASKLMQFEQVVRDAVQTLLDFDLFQAVGRFARDYQLSIPRLADGKGVGLGFQDGRNLFLTQQALQGKLEVSAVSYTVGQTIWKPEHTAGERVILLSGANSGGKSCLLQNVIQVAILAQMGMLVPAAKAEVSIFDELYYYAKSHGMLSAGAFETSLNNLANIVTSDASKLACFDEWEASTEPGAAAKVVAAVLELFHENPNSCVIFVSHLSDDILQLCRVPIRVDGIEASGLDADLNLVVSRSPKFGKIAKSTPELIVERLFRSSQDKRRQIFERILELIRRTDSRKR